jgi:hypothetical protein
VMDLHHLLLAGLPAHSGLPLETDIVRVGRHVSKVPEPDLICPSMKRAMRHEPPDYSGSPTAGASDAYSKHIQELGPTLLSMTLSR